jgi:CDP-2,3-bis-(O-geranylgeranyl)-sn-glycerol synthase
MEMVPVELRLLALIVIANGTPIVAATILGQRGAWPVDGGWVWADGYRLLGDSKTWRGVMLAPLAAGVGAVLLGLPLWVGGAVGVAAMSGDMLSSFIKRRLGVPPSGRATGLDQIPESLLPLLAVAGEFALTGSAILSIVIGFVVLEITLSPIFHRLGLRDRPY